MHIILIGKRELLQNYRKLLKKPIPLNSIHREKTQTKVALSPFSEQSCRGKLIFKNIKKFLYSLDSANIKNIFLSRLLKIDSLQTSYRY